MGATQRVVRLTPLEATDFFDILINEFIDRPAFQRIDGRPVISMLNLPDFASTYGLAGLRFLIGLLRARVQDRLSVDPFVIGLLPNGSEGSARIAASLPCDAITAYGLLPDWVGPPRQDYRDLVKRRVGEWYRIQRLLTVPFIPVICAGWDASRRGVPVQDLRSVRSFPWRPVVVNSAPDEFGAFLAEAKRFLAETESPLNLIYIHAWNEWSEGSAIEPGEVSGTAYLQALSDTAAR